jgi:hypothetical protein
MINFIMQLKPEEGLAPMILRGHAVSGELGSTDHQRSEPRKETPCGFEGLLLYMRCHIDQRWGNVGAAFGWNSADALIVSLKALRRVARPSLTVGPGCVAAYFDDRPSRKPKYLEVPA